MFLTHKLERGYWGIGGNGTFTRFPIKPQLPLSYITSILLTDILKS